MTQPAIRYRLIKKEKHTGARLRGIGRAARNFSHTNVHASRNISYSKNNVPRRG